MTEAPPLIGPGRLVLVVGPSGSGKDTIIAGAKTACAGDPMVVFPRRVVTRTASAAEDHYTLDDSAFDRAVTIDAFAFWWQAHGLKYGIPRGINDDIRAGRTIICNVSRTVIGHVREKYAEVDVVLITAPAAVLAARIAGRSRASDGPLDERIKRNAAFQDFAADYIVENIGEPAIAIETFVKIIHPAHHPDSA
jgi:ribose 1,5-bisphosphokinase